MPAKNGGKLTRKAMGRPKGSKNKVTSDVRQLILEAAAALQTDKKTALKTWAKENTTDFYTKVFVKILPKEIKETHEGELVITWQKKS